MAYAAGRSQHHHADKAPRTQVASNEQNSGAAAGAGAPMQAQENNADGDSNGGGGGVELAGGDGTVGSPNLTNGGAHGALGPGDGHDGPGSNGFMPNGENGLMVLADYARSQGADGSGVNSNNNSDNTPGLPPGGPNTPGGDGPGQGPRSDGFTRVADPNGGGGGGSGFGGGGSGGGGGLGVGGSGGVDPQIPLDNVQTPPDTGLTTPGTGSGDGGGAKVCVVSVFDSCGQPPAGGPHTLMPVPDNQPPVAAPPGGGPLEDGAPVPAVPEPATWLMMILGFGAAGSTLRTQRRRTRAALA